MSAVTVTLELSAEQAAALARFADKTGFHEAMAVLYAHKPANVRATQAGTILAALCVVERALADAGVRAWPWVETGRAS